MLLPWLVLVFVLVVAVWGLVHSLRQKAEIHREHVRDRDVNVTGRHHHHA